jgi:hypothetical protein
MVKRPAGKNIISPEARPPREGALGRKASTIIESWHQSYHAGRVMYLSATGAQVKNQFFASLDRFRSRPALAIYTWLETELRNPHGGRATEVSGNIEGIHDQFESPASLLVDEAKSIRDEVLQTLERCSTTFHNLPPLHV